MTSTRILVVDDEPNILKLITSYLEKEGYQIFQANDGPSALQAAKAFNPDLIILDILLPGMDGLEVLTQIRRESQVYIIMLTARTEETDKIIGLSIGADDYMTKPFSPRELVARVKAALRRLQSSNLEDKKRRITSKNILIDNGSRRAWENEVELDLTPIEFALLYTLAQHRGLVLSRDQLLEKVWDNTFSFETRMVDVHISHLRKKMSGDYIQTVRGTGYRFEDEVVK
ncbi:MAG: response regulator transcription factor [Anaerolineaceae bacterium]|nr:response regulator transcription factor [Anaerolineaceae bacterium]